MGKEPSITYIGIPGEISMIIKKNTDTTQLEQIIDKYEVSCIVFAEVFETYKEIEIMMQQPDIANLIINNINLNFAWFTNFSSMPYKNEMFDFIKLKDTLYFKYQGNSKRSSWIEISPLTKDQLDSMDPLYFEKFNELSIKQ